MPESSTNSSAVHAAPCRKSVVVMVEPIKFFCNEATCEDNYFQNKEAAATNGGNAALAEHRGVFESLVARGINCVTYRLSSESGLGEAVVDENGKALSKEAELAHLSEKPDAIFPNNSFSFHELGSFSRIVFEMAGVKSSATNATAVVLYPMCPGRRNEIPRSLLEKIKHKSSIIVRPRYVGSGEGDTGLSSLANWELTFEATRTACSGGDDESCAEALPTVLVDLRGFENVDALATGCEKRSTKWWALEGTGSLNFSATYDSVFATASQRCHPIPFHLLCEALGIAKERRFLIPRAVDTEQRCIYHTNVVGWVGDGGICGWCSSSLCFDDDARLKGFEDLYTTRERFEEEIKNHYGEHFFKLSFDNLVGFAGNAMFLRSNDGVCYVAMSQTAATSLGDAVLERMNSALAGLSSLDPAAVKAKHDDLRAKDSSATQLFSQFPHIIACPIPTIERLGGGSVRCLLASSLSQSAAGYAALQDLVAHP